MKLIKTSFYNYKILKNANVTFEDSITIIIGKNNSGKTSILDGISLGLSEYKKILKSDNDLVRCINKKSTSENFSMVSTIQLEREDLHKVSKRSEQFRYGFLPHEEQILLVNPILIYFEFDKEKGISIKGSFEDILIKKYNHLVGGHHDMFVGIVIDILSESILYIKPDRRIPNSEQFVPFDEFLTDSKMDQHICHFLLKLKEKDIDRFNRFLDEFNQIFNSIQIEPFLDYNDGNVKIRIKQAGEQFDINEMGNGFKYILLTLSRILVSNPKIVLMDEPDLNLHPDLLRQLVNYLKNLTDIQFVISSHDETFVNEFDDNYIRYSYTDKPYTAQITTYDNSKYSDLMDDLGIYVSNFGKSRLLKSRLIILYEGDEQRYIKKFITKGNLTDITKLDIYFGKTEGVKRFLDIGLLENITYEKQNILIIRDRDENTEQYINHIKKKYKDKVMFWNRREIESYALEYDSILLTIKNKYKKRYSKNLDLKIEDLKSNIRNLAEELKKKVLILRIISTYDFFSLYEKDHTGKKKFHDVLLDNSDFDSIPKTAASMIFEKLKTKINEKNLEEEIENIKKKLNTEWTEDGILKICPPFELLKKINHWINETYGINNITFHDLIDNLNKIDQDIIYFIDLVKKMYDLKTGN